MPEITLTTVRGINCSDPRSFRSLYDAYYSYLCGLAASYIHDFEKARELVNDVFLRVWERRTEFKYPPLPYLISSVRNACYNYLRDVRKASMVTLEFVERIPDTALQGGVLPPFPRGDGHDGHRRAVGDIPVHRPGSAQNRPGQDPRAAQKVAIDKRIIIFRPVFKRGPLFSCI